MPLTSVGDQYLVTIRSVLNNQAVLSTYCYRLQVLDPAFNTSGAVAAQMQAVFMLPGGLIPTYRSCCPTNMTINGTQIQVIRPVRFVSDFFAIGLNGTGGSTSEAQNLACTITRKGDLANRKCIGSLHIPLPTGPLSVLGGVIQPLQSAAMLAHGTQMIATVAPGLSTTQLIPILNNKNVFPGWNQVRVCTPQLAARTMHRRTLGLGI